VTRLADIQAHVAGMQELSQIIGSMRAVANLRVQEALGALSSVRQYGAAMREALGQALSLTGAAQERRGGRPPEPAGAAAGRIVIVCTSELGFVGAFNEPLIEQAAQALTAADRLFILGSRGTAWAHERRLPVYWSRPMAAHLAGVPRAVQTLVEAVYGLIAHGRAGAAEVIYAGCRRGSAPVLTRRRLFPLQEAAAGPAPANPPLHYLPTPLLLERLTEAYIFALLTEAVTESIASENNARFLAMQAAHDNAARRLGELRQALALARQDEITTELLDLVTGAMALAPRRLPARQD